LLSRQALHAEELVFVHPVSRSLLRLTAPLPEDLVRLAQQIEGMDRRKE
jgi:23S rRNA pseudouridine1911/1915/1917 synthase